MDGREPRAGAPASAGTRSKTFRIRPAGREDAVRILPLYEWLFEGPGYRPASWDEGRVRRALETAIDARDTAVLLAEDQAGFVGICTAYLDLESVRYGCRCWVEDLAVDPARRSRGIGSALLEAARAWAVERGATHLELDTGLDRIDAQRFYEREAPARKGVSYSWDL